jgi:hypothetical protein
LCVQEVPAGRVGAPFRCRGNLQGLQDPADVDALTRWPGLSSTPWILLDPQALFPVASRLVSAAIAVLPVPLEYSIGRVTCTVANMMNAVMVGCRVLLKIVYLLTCRVLGLAVLVFRGDRGKMPSCSCSGTRTRCCAAMPAGYGTSRATGCGSRRWHGVYRAGAGPTSSL